MAELLEERGQSMAEQVACMDTLLRQEPVRQDPSGHRELIRRLSMGRAVAAAISATGGAATNHPREARAGEAGG